MTKACWWLTFMFLARYIADADTPKANMSITMCWACLVANGGCHGSGEEHAVAACLPASAACTPGCTPLQAFTWHHDTVQSNAAARLWPNGHSVDTPLGLRPSSGKHMSHNKTGTHSFIPATRSRNMGGQEPPFLLGIAMDEKRQAPPTCMPHVRQLGAIITHQLS